MTTLKVSDLSIHPKNEYYFDDMSGEKWDQFLKSVKNNGVRTPIIVTDDMRVVSGNQRVRACLELGISVINAEIEHYANENDVIRDLIEINIRQRGAIDDSEIKQARRIAFLQDYYGIKQGGDRKSKPNNSVLKTQSDLANELGMSVDTLQNYAKLTDLIPEMQDLVDTGIVTKTVALSVLKRLSPEEQRQLAEQISGKERVSNKDVSQYVEQIKAASEENERLRRIVSEKEAENVRLKNQKQEVREVIKEVEVPPSDYDLIQKERKQFLSERNKANARIKELEEREGIHDMQMKLERESEYLETQISTFIRTVGGYVWITEKIEDLPEDKRMDVIKAIKNINAWSQQMLTNIGGNIA